MKYLLISFLLANLTIGLKESIIAQGVDTGVMQTDFVELNIPPLSVILDSALATNAMVRFRDQGIVGKQSNLNSYKNYWTRNLGVLADVRYGTFNNFSTNTSEGQSPSMFATNTTQTVYGIGFYLKFPLQDMVDRKNQIVMAKSELDQARSMAENQRQELREKVIKHYYDVLLKQRVLTIKSENLSNGRVNMDMAEKQFQNGVISVTEYTRISGIVSDDEAEFEIAKTEFLTSYMILEEIAGFDFQ